MGKFLSDNADTIGMAAGIAAAVVGCAVFCGATMGIGCVALIGAASAVVGYGVRVGLSEEEKFEAGTFATEVAMGAIPVPGIGAIGKAVGKAVGKSSSQIAQKIMPPGRDELVDLYRHVSWKELGDIRKNGFRGLPDGRGTIAGKWFAESYNDAVRWGEWLNGGVGRVVRVSISKEFAERLHRIPRLDNIGPGIFVESWQLRELNKSVPFLGGGFR
jgi:hypothetical protein